MTKGFGVLIVPDWKDRELVVRVDVVKRFVKTDPCELSMTELVKRIVLTAGLHTILLDTASVLTWIWGTAMELMATFPVEMEFTKIVDATSVAVLKKEVGERLTMEFWTVQEEAVKVEAVKFVVTMELFTWSEFV